MYKSLNTFLIIIDTDFPISGNYCVLYEGIYLYFFKNFKDTAYGKTVSGYFGYVYLVYVVSKLRHDTTLEKVTLFLRSWTISNRHKIRFVNTMYLRDHKDYEEFLRKVYIPLEQAENYKISREKTEFKKIVTTNYKSTKKTELLKLYSVAVSDTNVYFQILFLIHTISYPDEKDKKVFISYVNSFFKKISVKPIPLYLANEIKKIKENKALGDIEKYKSPEGEISYGDYFYNSIRSSITHVVRHGNSDSNEENKKPEIDKKVINIKMDDFDQIEVLRSAAKILNEIAYSRLTHEGIFNSFIPNDKCYLIEDPNIQKIAALTDIYLDGILELDQLEIKLNQHMEQGNLTILNYRNVHKNNVEQRIKERIRILTLDINETVQF